MEGKVSLKRNAHWSIGLVFTLLGGLFCIVGVLVMFLPEEEGAAGMAMGLTGGGFFLAGMVFVVRELWYKRCARKLMEEGRWGWGEIWDVVPDMVVRINKSHPHYVMVRYTDPLRQIYTFRSRSLRIPRRTDLVGRRVRVYVSGDDCRRYHVDLDSVFCTTGE